jgi:hypothetical protein
MPGLFTAETAETAEMKKSNFDFLCVLGGLCGEKSQFFTPSDNRCAASLGVVNMDTPIAAGAATRSYRKGSWP